MTQGELLRTVLGELGYVSPAWNGKPKLDAQRLSEAVRERGQLHIPPHRLVHLCFDRARLYADEAVALAGAHGLDVRVFLYELVPGHGKNPGSILELLRSKRS